MRFQYTSHPSRVVFGPGRVSEVPAEVERLGVSRVFLVADAQAKDIADETTARLGSRIAGRWHEVIQHVPVELAERARAAVTESGADGVVCLGGGSSTGLAKAIALSHELPILAVPTTYAGSEMTTIYGLTGGRHKQTGTSPVVLPKVVVYDPELTTGLPPNVTGPSAFNALAHSVEALYATGCNPVTSALALEGVRAIARSLPTVMADPADIDGRSDLLYGAYLSGIALGTTSAGLHHKLCHVLGGTFNLVHADAHAAVLPHAVAFNAPALPSEMARLAEALGVPGDDPAGALWDLAAASSVTTNLAALGLTAADLPEAAERAAGEITANPVPIDADALLGILQRAFTGERPAPRRLTPSPTIRIRRRFSPSSAPGPPGRVRAGEPERVGQPPTRRSPPRLRRHLPHLPTAARRGRRDPRTPVAAFPAASSGTASGRRPPAAPDRRCGRAPP